MRGRSGGSGEVGWGENILMVWGEVEDEEREDTCEDMRLIS